MHQWQYQLGHRAIYYNPVTVMLPSHATLLNDEDKRKPSMKKSTSFVPYAPASNIEEILVFDQHPHRSSELLPERLIDTFFFIECD